MSIGPAPHVCASCRNPLTYIQETGEPGFWIHSTPHDHDPNPVPRVESDESRLQPVCDFCGMQTTVESSWIYPATPFRADSLVREDWEHRDDGEGWSACSRCARLIEEGRRTDLAARAAVLTERRNPGLGSYESFLVSIEHAHGVFFAHRSGPGFPAREYMPPL